MKAMNSILNPKKGGRSNNKLKEPRIELIIHQVSQNFRKIKEQKKENKYSELKEFSEEKREKRMKTNLEGKF